MFVFTARNRELLDEVVDEINGAGGEGYAVAVDLTILESCQKVVKETVERFGGVDILVNNAGAARGGDILDLPTELIDDALGLKSYSYLRMSQLVIPHMRQNGWGRIINVAGGAGTQPYQWKHSSEPCEHRYFEYDPRTFGCGLRRWDSGEHNLSRTHQHPTRARCAASQRGSGGNRCRGAPPRPRAKNSPQGVSLNRRRLRVW